jgi:UDP-glucose 4-epimerase
VGEIMRVLVTGGCGFIGANLARRLAGRRDVQLRVFDNESLGRRAFLGDFGGEFIHGDIRDRAALDRALDGMDAVVHLAADTRVIESIANPGLNFDINVVGSLNLLEAMRVKGIKRLINASTGGAILGDAVPPINERMPARPLAPYGASKLAVEGYCSAYAGSYGLEALSLRFANVYGPGSHHKGSVVATFFKRLMAGLPLVIYGDGSQARDFIYIDDLCDGVIAGLTGAARGVVQLGSGHPVTLSALIESIRQAVAPLPVTVAHEPFRVGEVAATWCDISHAQAVLGFAADTPIELGLERTWRWFLEESRRAA